jgi:hypothetical protein
VRKRFPHEIIRARKAGAIDTMPVFLHLLHPLLLKAAKGGLTHCMEAILASIGGVLGQTSIRVKDTLGCSSFCIAQTMADKRGFQCMPQRSMERRLLHAFYTNGKEEKGKESL